MDFYGLNSYEDNRFTELGFTNFQWTLEDRVARSSQPRYIEFDEPHGFGPVEISFLKKHNIKCIISANKYAIVKVQRTLLANAGIEYLHYVVEDFKAPTREQLQNAANRMQETIDDGGAALVYCGYGQGRTGTFVAGWAMQKHEPLRRTGVNRQDICTLDTLRAEFGVETQVQVNAVRDVAA